MRRFFYRKSTGDIIFNDTLEVVKLNKIAQQIYEKFLEGKSEIQISHEIAEQYSISEDEVCLDVSNTLWNLDELQILKYTKSNYGLQLHTVIMHIIKNCNSPCKICDCWQTKQKSWHSHEHLKPTILWLKDQMQNQNVMVSGGEPLLHPEIKEIAASIKKQKMKVLLNTNGLLLHRHSWINSSTVDEVVISMDGFDSHSYKSLRGVDAYDRVWENIKGLKARDLELKVSFRVIINAINISNLEQILDRASLEGIDRVGFSPLDITSTSFGRQSLTDEKALSLMSEYLPSQQQIEKFRLLLKSSAKIGSAIESNLCDWNQEDFERCLKYYENLHYGQNPNYGMKYVYFR
jgi:MoaA/NifB/PqqE/SkfB family radical SAM enzyme